ncbi:MAG: NAD(P)H-binding protein [Nitrospinaceae bacterium]|nr:NAD(P)H-binding protein [Nitrospinaceae bacterium]
MAGYAVDSVGSIHAIDGAKAAGVDRFILISSIGVGDSEDALPPPVLKVLGEALAGKFEAEKHLAASGLNWTVIRPGVLNDKPVNGNGILTEDTSAMGVVARAEIARLTVESIGNEETYGKTYSAVEQKP